MSAVRLYEQLIQAKGLTSRSSQLKMIASLDQHFNLENQEASQVNQIMIEAPTGVGKSIAYLVAALPQLADGNVTFLISTASKVLQSQLINKDIPDVLSSLDLNYRYEIVKGRENYLCLAKLEQECAGILKKVGSEVLDEISSKTKDDTWDGDLNQINIENITDKQLTAEFGCDEHYCMNTQCPFFAKCYLFNKKKQIQKSAILVTNHAMLAAISSNLRPYLGVLDDNHRLILCIDEAHNFAEIYRDSSKDDLNLAKMLASIDNHQSLISSLLNNSNEDEQKKIGDNLSDLQDSLTEFLKICSTLRVANLLAEDKQFLITPQLTPPADLLKIGLEYSLIDNISKCIAISAQYIHKFLVEQYNQKENEAKRHSKSQSYPKVNQFLNNLSRITEIYGRVNKIFEKVNVTYQGKLNYGIWLTLNIHGFNINYSNIEVADSIIKNVYNNFNRTALVSATLSIDGNFGYKCKALGVSTQQNCYRLPHVFDYRAQGNLILPKFKYSPKFNTRTEYEAELLTFLNNLLVHSNDGVLVLFTNRLTMSKIYRAIDQQIRPFIKSQLGGQTPAQVLNEHKSAISAGKPSVIFGLKSFFEGVDLKGKLCTKVVITALPFLVHSEPLYKYKEHNLKLIHQNGFDHYSLPEAAITLIQMAGRLIRSEKDTGDVIICDKRLKAYQILIRSLPPFKQISVPATNSAPPHPNQAKSERLAAQIIKIINAAGGWISYAKIAVEVANKHCFEALVNDDKDTTVANLINRFVLRQGEFKRIKYRWSVNLIGDPAIKEFYCNFISTATANQADIDPEIVKSKLLPIIYTKEQYSYSDFEELGLQYLGVERG